MTAANSYPVTMTLGLDDKASKAFAQAIAKVNGEMRKAQTGWQKFAKAGVGDKFSMAGKAMTDAGKKMTMGVTLPLLGIGAASVKASMDFNQGMGNVATLVNTNTESMADMSRAVLELGKRTPVALSDLTAGLYQVRSSGIGAGDAMRVLEGSAQLAVAGLSTTKEAVDISTSAINAWGIKAEDQSRVFDTLFATVKMGKTTIAELSQGFGATASQMAANGVQLDEYMSTVAALTLAGPKASEAQTQLKAVLAGLTRESKESSAVFKRLGAKNFRDLIAQSGGLVGALNRIKDVTGEDIGQLLKLEGSTEALGATLGLTGPLAKAQADALAEMRDKSGQASAAFRTQAEQQWAQMQMSRNAVEAAAVSVGDKLSPAIGRAATRVGELADKWESIGPEAQNMVLLVAGLLAFSGPLMTAVGAVSSGIAGIGTVATASGTAITAAFGAASAAALALTGVVASLAAVGVMLSKLSDVSGEAGITGTVGKMWEMGTLDYFAANDAALNEAARKRYGDQYGSAAQASLPEIAGYAGKYSSTGAAGAAGGAKPAVVENTIRVETSPGLTVSTPRVAPGTTVDQSRRGPVGG